MDFCDNCGNMLPAGQEAGSCESCGEEFGDPSASNQSQKSSTQEQSSPTTELEQLATTKSGNIKKSDAMEWLKALNRPSSAEMKRSVLEKPNDFTGSTFPTDISTIRLTGDAEFIETIAGLFQWIVSISTSQSRTIDITVI